MINLKKIEKIEELAFRNALRLHNDAMTLFKSKSFPSSYFLSVLCQEEIGKAYMLSDFLWHSRIDGRWEENEERKWILATYNHIFKQTSFFRFQFDGSERMLKKMESVSAGKLETMKQASVYVGLKRSGKNVNLKGKIVSPFNIKKETSQKQITMMNDFLIDLMIGVICEYYIWDTDKTSQIMKKGLVNKMLKEWKPSYNLIRRIKKVIKNNKLNAKWVKL